MATANALNLKQEDKDFIAKFLETYQRLNEGSRNLVLAFVWGMDFQRALDEKDG